MLGWFASHLVAIGFIVFAGIAVVFRGPLFDTAAISESQGTSDARVVESVPRDEKTPEVEHNSAKAASHVDRPESDSVARDALSENVSGNVSTPVFRPTDATKQNTADVASKNPGKATPEVSVKPVFRDPDLQPAEPAMSPRAHFEALLRQARAAVKADKPEQAESLYLRCLKMSPENPVVFAELGDLYRSTGRTQDALDAYYEAGVRFGSRGAERQLAQIRAILAKAGDSRIRKLPVPRPDAPGIR
jgi:hypothetical protein